MKMQLLRQVANEPIHKKKDIIEIFEREFSAGEMVRQAQHIFKNGELRFWNGKINWGL